MVGLPLVCAVENYADIPDDFSLTYGEGTQIIFWDEDVERTVGAGSIRLEPHTSGDVNVGRECDGIWYNVSAGDRIVASVWMRTLTNSSTLDYPDCGARFGIDWYGYVDGVYQLLFADDFWTDYYDGNFTQMYVCDYNGGAWQQRTLNVVVPVTAENMAHEEGTVTNVVMWLQGAPWTEDASSVNVWFADASMYIYEADDSDLYADWTENIVGWSVPAMVFLIPAGVGYKFLGGFGFMAGLNVGGVGGYAFGLVGLWAVVLVGVVDLLFIYGSRR